MQLLNKYPVLKKEIQRVINVFNIDLFTLKFYDSLFHISIQFRRKFLSVHKLFQATPSIINFFLYFRKAKSAVSYTNFVMKSLKYSLG